MANPCFLCSITQLYNFFSASGKKGFCSELTRLLFSFVSAVQLELALTQRPTILRLTLKCSAALLFPFSFAYVITYIFCFTEYEVRFRLTTCLTLCLTACFLLSILCCTLA